MAYGIKREIRLSLNNDAKRLLVQNLKRYKDKLHRKMNAMPQKFYLAVLHDELSLVDDLLRQINGKWKESLPTIATAGLQQDRVELFNQFCDLRTSGGLLQVITPDLRIVEVSYQAGLGYTVKVDHEVKVQTIEVQKAFGRFMEWIQ
ncbi:hypothetical protein [Laceyella putida]|uniref:Uncharacterized protein n=1 Tax=Laceyella putida TaxID=110101 RepID=A0ABW2RJI0_9BACL